MMDFLNAMKLRYTTKVYDPSRSVDTQLIQELKEIVQLSPSSINSQPWRFTFVSEPALKIRLAEASYFNEQKIRDAHLLVVVSCVEDIAMFEEWLNQTQPKGAVDYYNLFVKPLSPTLIKAWMQRQVYMAVGVLLSACAAMGIDSSPMEGIEVDKYNQILPYEGYSALCAVAIGYRNPDDYNQPALTPKSRRDAHEVIFAR